MLPMMNHDDGLGKELRQEELLVELLGIELWALPHQDLVFDDLLDFQVCIIAGQLISKGDKNDLFACNSVPEQAGRDEGQQEDEGLRLPGQLHLLRHSWCVRIAYFAEKLYFYLFGFHLALEEGG